MTEASRDETATADGSAHALPEPCTGESPEGPAVVATPVLLARERSTRVGVYAAEHDVLVKLGWNMRFRLESSSIGLTTVTADILPPAGQLESGPQSFFRCTAWKLTNQAAAELKVVRERVLTLTGKLPAWDAPIGMGDELWLVCYMAWRDSYEGALPPGFPFKATAEAA